jgi:hypothetical protein
MGDAPVINASPSEYDYGSITLGCDNREHVTIRNEGNMVLEIEDITQMVTQPVDINVAYGTLPSFPWTIGPNNEIDFYINYNPLDLGIDASQLTITSNDPTAPEVILSQEGEGIVEQYIDDEWQQEEIPILDILWVIDNSGSMRPFQTALATQINDFMNVFLAATPDFHMAFISTDNHNFYGQMIDSTTSDPGVEAASAINLLTTFGAGNERGLEMSRLSLSDSSAAGPGGDFFRNDATLVVVYVSDEKDYNWATVGNYYAFFDALKPAGKFMPFAVIGDYPSGCSYNGNYYSNVEFGRGYWDLVDHYNGSWYSICAPDWGIQLQNLANQVTARNRFSISQPDPVEETIKVYVNGQELSEGWSFDLTDLTITFEEAYIPEPGQSIRIEYAVWGC